MRFDYIIVGQGIAGTMISYFLLRENASVLVIDKFDQHSASNVSGGLINPVTGRKLTKTWRAEEIIPFAKKIYQQLSKETGEQYFFEKKILKLFGNITEQNDWLAKTAESDAVHFIKEFHKEKELAPFIHIESGGVEVLQGGHVALQSVVNTFRNRLIDLGILANESFDFNDLKLERGKVKYRDWEAGKIIFCEGPKVRDNPYFNKLPFALTKGELLIIDAQELPEDRIYNKNFGILPVGGHKFKVGATYRWNDLDNQPTEEGRKELIEKLESIIKVPYKIISQKAGIRPTVKDRRPLIGTHPEFPELVIFNGMGSKGASLAPFFAKQLSDHLQNGTPLDPEVDILRYPGELEK